MDKDEKVFRSYATPLDLKERRGYRIRRFFTGLFWFFITLIVCGLIIFGAAYG